MWLFNVNTEQPKRNVVIRHCPFSWQCLGTNCSCDKEAPAAFSMGSVWSPTIQPRLCSLWFSLFPHMKWWIGGQHFGTENELQTSIVNWLKTQVTVFLEKAIGKLVPSYKKCLLWSGNYVEKELVGIAKYWKTKHFWFSLWFGLQPIGP